MFYNTTVTFKLENDKGVKKVSKKTIVQAVSPTDVEVKLTAVYGEEMDFQVTQIAKYKGRLILDTELEGNEDDE